MVSNIFYFHPYLWKIPILTNTFQMGSNHQLDKRHHKFNPFHLHIQRFFSDQRCHGDGRIFDLSSMMLRVVPSLMRTPMVERTDQWRLWPKKTWWFAGYISGIISIHVIIWYVIYQWLFLVPLKGGIGSTFDPPEGKDYKWYISGIYCQLGDYMPPTTF